MLVWAEKLSNHSLQQHKEMLFHCSCWILTLLFIALVVSSIQQLGVEVEHFPGCCISLYQPVDVGINRSLKANSCKDWEDWILGSGISTFTTSPQKRYLIVEWVIKAYNKISVEVVINSWKHYA